jgi:hypothetical protein
MAGLIWPHLIRNRPLFLTSAALVVLAMTLSAMPLFLLTRLSETAAFVMLVLAGNDISLREWKRLILK